MISLALTPSSVNQLSMFEASGVGVTKYSGSHTKFRVKSDEDMGQRIGGFLRARYPRKTSEAVAADLSISATTVASWLDGKSVPGGVALKKLLAVYGPEFGAAAFDLDWLKEVARDAERERLKKQISALEARVAGLGT